MLDNLGWEIMQSLEHCQFMEDPAEMLMYALHTSSTKTTASIQYFVICLHKNFVLSKGSLLKISLCFKCFDSDCINLHDAFHNSWKIALLMMDTQHFFEISLQWELRGKTALARHQNLRKSQNTANNIFVLCLNNYFHSMRTCARNPNYIHFITFAQVFCMQV